MMMKKLILFVIFSVVAVNAVMARTSTTNPVAAPEAVVVCGNARFTVLTSRLIRMEWAVCLLYDSGTSGCIFEMR